MGSGRSFGFGAQTTSFVLGADQPDKVLKSSLSSEADAREEVG